MFQTAYIRFGRWVVSSKHQVLKTPLALRCHVAIERRAAASSAREEDKSRKTKTKQTKTNVTLEKDKFFVMR